MLWLWSGLVGFLLGYLFFAIRYRRNRPEDLELLLEVTSEDERITLLQNHVTDLENTIANYESYINDYFETTAEHVNQFTEHYQELFEHLQASAYTLADAKALKQKQN